MASERDYRAESKAARLAARHTLAALRDARRKGKSGATAAAPAKAGRKADVGLTPESMFQMDMASPPPAAAPEAEPQAVAAALTEAEADTTGAIAEAPTDNILQDDPTAEMAAPASESAADADMAAPSPSAEPETTQPEHAPLHSDVATIDPESDLFQLPGVGAGMIWMFNQCGIHTMAELAAADKADLTQRLGVVGKILNVEPWMNFAREAGAAQAAE